MQDIRVIVVAPEGKKEEARSVVSAIMEMCTSQGVIYGYVDQTSLSCLPLPKQTNNTPLACLLSDKQVCIELKQDARIPRDHHPVAYADQ